MIVIKFGGTSVGDATSIQNVAKITQNSLLKSADGVLVVLSAMSGVTNLLIESANCALAQSEYLDKISIIAEKHDNAIDKLIVDPRLKTSVKTCIKVYLDELKIILQGINYLGELSDKSLDNVQKFGELMSSQIFSHYLNQLQIKNELVDARNYIITDDNFGRAKPNFDEITKRVKSNLYPKFNHSPIIITQGFIGSCPKGNTTLGRGGSDYSAALFGASLDASCIEIWTDVDGMMTCDPRLIPEAKVIDEVSFEEASELAYFGAKVLHPLTIAPAIEKAIAVKILNSKNPSHPGTLISKSVKESVDSGDNILRAIAFKNGITAIFITSSHMLMAYGFVAEVFSIFEKYKTSIDLITTSEVSIAITIDNPINLDQIINELKNLGEICVERDLSIVTVVGKKLRSNSGISGHIFEALKDINILMISGGASDINISFVVHKSDAANAVKAIHNKFF